jgi:glutathione-regulated potassium-efflux system ancillary protein KefG
MPRILILFVHPRFEQSRTNAALVKSIPKRHEITFHDLYERYPDFNIDTEAEKAMLTAHDIIVWHHPFYWYNIPPLLKQWIDMVLEFGWAYGPGGKALEGKIVFNAFTSGGPREAYQHEGRNRFTVREFLAPIEQTAILCQMTYLPPFAVQGTHKLSMEHLLMLAQDYHDVLNRFVDGDFKTEEVLKHSSMNDWIAHLKTQTA